MLAESLTSTRKVLFRPKTKRISSFSLSSQPAPKIQTADTLLLTKKLKFDIPKIDSLLELAATDLCCISGYGANLLLTRLCVRSLLPQRYGGLDSPYVMVADTSNQTDVYGVANFARQYGMSKENAAERILVVRAFTVYQVRRLFSVELPKVVHKYQVKCVIIPGLLNVFDDEEYISYMRAKEVKKEIAKITEAINQLSARLLVVTSVQKRDNKHSELVLRVFKKRINLVLQNEKHGTLRAEIYNLGNSKVINLTERDLKIISKS